MSGQQKNRVAVMTKTLQLYEQLSYELNLFRERRLAALKKQPCGTPERSRKGKGADRNPEAAGRLPRDMH